LQGLVVPGRRREKRAEFGKVAGTVSRYRPEIHPCETAEILSLAMILASALSTAGCLNRRGETRYGTEQLLAIA